MNLKICLTNIFQDTKVRYWWTEDGQAELCNAIEKIAQADLPCYHRDCKIKKGNTYYELTAKDQDKYILCKKCFDEATKIL